MVPKGKVPLVEAIFEMRWGRKDQNTFEFSNDEQSLMPGKIIGPAEEAGFSEFESLDSSRASSGALFPQRPTHRYRRGKGKWPLLQLGLGLFTVNQAGDGYEWETFRKDVESGVSVFKSTNPENIIKSSKFFTLALRYNNGFFPSDEGLTNEQFIEQHFSVDIALPDKFKSHDDLLSDNTDFGLTIVIPIRESFGQMTVKIAPGHVFGRNALLMETIIESAPDSFSIEDSSVNEILDWCNRAHGLQDHVFETLIHSSALR